MYFASLGLQIILHIHAFIFTHIWSFGHPLQKHYYWIRAAALTLRPQNLSFQMLCLTDWSNSYIHVFTFINVRNNLTVEAFVSKLKGSAIYIDSCHKSHNFINNWTKYFLMWYCDPNSWVAESSERQYGIISVLITEKYYQTLTKAKMLYWSHVYETKKE